MRLIVRRSVDFPHPDGPMIAVTALTGIAMLTSFSACALAVVEIEVADIDHDAVEVWRLALRS